MTRPVTLPSVLHRCAGVKFTMRHRLLRETPRRPSATSSRARSTTAGTIDLDGHRADPELWRAWRAHVGVVAQDDRLLSGTIADNIAFFDPDLDMKRVQEAALAAQVHDDIMRQPMQYLGLVGDMESTLYLGLVGDMGSTLSGGQRQRVLLARALYGRPRILVLDEGTANLDEATEETIADLIAKMPITRIVVAHRPALIRRANRIFIGRSVRLRPRTAFPRRSYLRGTRCRDFGLQAESRKSRRWITHLGKQISTVSVGLREIAQGKPRLAGFSFAGAVLWTPDSLLLRDFVARARAALTATFDRAAPQPDARPSAQRKAWRLLAARLSRDRFNSA
jgi:ABC-type lipoprotein export system ATPase subunit